MGVYRYRDIVDPEGVPPIVTPELFETVQKEIKKRAHNYTKRKTKTGPVFLLTGKLFCGHCLAPMAGDSARSETGAVYYWYTCQNVKHPPKGAAKCNKKRVPKDWLEREVLRIVNTEILTDEFIEQAAAAAVEYEKHFDNNAEIEALRHELSQTENKIKNVTAAIATGVVTKTLPALLSDLERQREQLEKAVAEKMLGVQEFSREAVAAYLNELKALSHKNAGSQRQIINACIKSVYLFDTDKKGELRLVVNMNLFDNDAEINHSEIVRLVTPELGGVYPNRTIYAGRRFLIVRTIQKNAAG